MMFALGVTIVLHELLFREIERPFLLALAGALMGLPFVLAADSIRRTDDDKEERWSHLP